MSARPIVALLGALAVALVVAAVQPPEAAATCSAPTVTGTLKVGSTLQAQVGGCSDLFPPNQTLQWYRCTSTASTSCTTSVKAAQGSPSAYKVTSADAGKRLGVKQVSSTPLAEEVDWRITAVVPVPTTTPSPPPPEPEPEPEPEPTPKPKPKPKPTPSPSPSPTPGDGGTGGGQPGSGAPTGTPLMSPFPSVAIGGRLTKRGARITRLLVRAPEGARILVRCRGGGCKAKRGRTTIGSSGHARLVRFQQHMRAGSVIKLLVVKPGVVGKYTRFEFRRLRPPLRTDKCATAGSMRAVACPA